MKTLTHDQDVYDSGVAEGMSQGISQGIDDINALNNWLISNNRSDEMIRAVTDKALQEQLMREYKEAII